MAQSIADRRDQEFVLHEMLNAADLASHDRFKEFNKKTMDMVLTEARNLAVKELLPVSKEGDETGCTLENGKVTIPSSFHRAYKLFCEGEWVAMCDDPEFGGQGMPRILSMAAGELFTGANCAFLMYPGLTHGAGKLVEEFGTEDQKKKYLENLYTGKWAGTMCLTEPEAGSDVGNLTTIAKRNEDGTFSITGSKIFISGGDQDLTENIIHPVLARIEGAPAGTKGISLFLVPKYRVNDDGTISEPNDVTCTGLEEKMGIHGNATASLAFGSKGNCIGELLGAENKGMKAMFVMMNEARLGVGLQGFGFASASYVNAVNYAKERIQGTDLTKIFDKDPKPVAIINHPDVKRQLLHMKAYVDGMRSLMYFAALCFDKVLTSTDDTDKDTWQGLIELLIPVVKGYITDRAFEVCTQGVQVFGGYGFISEYPQEQLLRDCKITSIYEGTNGIQAMDLLGRKLGLKKGKPFMDLLTRMNQTIAAAKEIPELADMAVRVETAVNKLGETAMHMGMTAMSEKVLDAFAVAHPFLDVTGDVVMAWLELWRAVTAQPKIGSAKKKDAAFYQGQVTTAKYFIQWVLPATLGKMDALKGNIPAIMEMPEDAFPA
ncbi:acyl-CoA dehydrogenase [Desulfotignum phosphitoxidans]|uniref:3-methylmercaptopropionyl-CoA dehydrogenase n=1 Tax=Desulfotignum phosphitoxidans DSM 13687 TaxID=1286635 RepID=S0G6X4_9BACT|nr:acyl-CoA dehydrogenase [Desulfotignum phosphitoxidans]EMS80662.1 short chain specific acyl-CoA dehydrogenase/butyryl CoA dehydrogenase Acd [Desulfotignum phosphitoxidans DSM 13687]